MTDIHDIKWKIDIINYMYLAYFLLLALFLYFFYYFLSKFFSEKKEILIEKDEKILTDIEQIQSMILELERKIDSIDTKTFLSELKEIFFCYLSMKFKKDFRDKTQKEIKNEIKDKDILKFYESFYYKSFMENTDLSLESMKNLLENFKLII